MDGTRRDTWVRGIRLASYEVGPADGDRVVVVPGLCVSSYLWPACDALARQGFHVDLVEPPGWPRSDRLDPEPDDLAGLAEWVTSWLAIRGYADVLLVGQSVGTQVAAHVAAQAPERVRALLLQGPVFDPAYRTLPRGLARWALDIPREKFSLGLREVPEWLRVGPRRVRTVLRQSLADRLEDTVATLDVPVRVVVGEHDTLSELPWLSSLSRPAAPPVVMGGLPHSSPHTAPDLFARLVALGYGRSSSGDSSGAGSLDSFGPPPESTVDTSGPSWSSSALSSDSGFSPA
jgi:pimeloyl-ACP methyl ester carboxylesterase